MITEALKKEVLSWPELTELIDNRAREIVMENKAKEPQQELTREQLASIHQLSTRTIDRKTPEELRRMGYIKHRRGANTRFEVIRK